MFWKVPFVGSNHKRSWSSEPYLQKTTTWRMDVFIVDALHLIEGWHPGHLKQEQPHDLRTYNHQMFASYLASLKLTYGKLSWVCWKIRFISFGGSFCLCSKANWVAVLILAILTTYTSCDDPGPGHPLRKLTLLVVWSQQEPEATPWPSLASEEWRLRISPWKDMGRDSKIFRKSWIF